MTPPNPSLAAVAACFFLAVHLLLLLVGHVHGFVLPFHTAPRKSPPPSSSNLPHVQKHPPQSPFLPVRTSVVLVQHQQLHHHHLPLLHVHDVSSSSSSSQEQQDPDLVESATASSPAAAACTTTKGGTATTTKGAAAIRSQRPTPTSCQFLQMVSFYAFQAPPSNNATTPNEDDPSVSLDSLRDAVFDRLSNLAGLRGSLYVAPEGVNGQFAVPVDLVAEFSAVIQQTVVSSIRTRREDNDKDDDELLLLNWGSVVPRAIPTFDRLIVRTRDAILRDGLDRIIVNSDDDDDDGTMLLDWTHAGEELAPNEWHEALRRSGHDHDTPHTSSSKNAMPLILDCRNEYESNQGTFRGAIPLNTTTFSESWDVLEQLLSEEENDTTATTTATAARTQKDKPVYIFCTGGIRCVKVGAYLTQKMGYQNVKRLRHGIIGYQKWYNNETVSNNMDDDDSSLWNGENFLFDKRRFAEASSSSSSSSLSNAADNGEGKRFAE